MYILSSDYDGTLFIDGEISKEDRKAIEKFREKGHLFVINTGRNLEDIFDQFDRNELEADYYIGSNGSIIADKDRNVIFQAQFSENTAKDIVEYFEENLKEDVFYIASNDGFVIGINKFDAEFEFDKENVVDLGETMEKPVITMFSQAREKNETRDIVDQLNREFAGKAKFFNTAPFIDITETVHDKSTGLRFLDRILDGEVSRIVAVGDELNDLSMITAFEGYAMKHASDFMKDNSDGQVRSVAKLIEKILK